MLSLTPSLLGLIYGLVMYRFSASRLNKTLNAQSVELMDPNLQPVISRMAQALDVNKIAVYIHEIEPVNGLAAPDGRIFITRGFYQKYQSGDVSGDELASVIAHELGHVALGHSRRRMIDFSGQNAIRVALSSLLGRLIPVAAVGIWVANILTSLLAARLSRADEYEADAYAASLLTASGIGTEPQKSLFRKLEALSGGGLRGGVAWLMSHPSTADRIKAIETLEDKWRGQIR